MLNFIRLLFLTILMLSSSIFGQYVKVTKILDSNLFELEDGRKIKLAGIDAPQLNSPIPFFQKVAEQAVFYSVGNILERRVYMELISKQEKSSYQLVHIKINYLFEKSDFNKSYLMKGFGKFFDNADTTFRNDLIDAQTHAIENKDGIWNYYTPVDTDTLDVDLTTSGIQHLVEIDSANLVNKLKVRPIYTAVPLELFAGTALFTIGSFGGGLLIWAITQPRGEMAGLGPIVGGFTLGYFLGFPSGIYLVAKNDNPNLSYLMTLGSSIVTALVTAEFSFALFPKDHNHPTRFIPLLSPIIGPLLYVHLFPPAYPTQEDITPQTESKSESGNIQKYYNSTMKFRMELFRINF
ncbi:MAG: thermonuclease family protein [Bacteroidetes bacterium]|nr:thermonuclease family protein [Bacteroidota bacterium]